MKLKELLDQAENENKAVRVGRWLYKKDLHGKYHRIGDPVLYQIYGWIDIEYFLNRSIKKVNSAWKWVRLSKYDLE